MIKTIIFACTISACVGGTALLVKLDAGPEQKPKAVSTLPSFSEMHANAHLDNLPVIIEKEPH